jgi:hypothetical protein
MKRERSLSLFFVVSLLISILFISGCANQIKIDSGLGPTIEVNPAVGEWKEMITKDELDYGEFILNTEELQKVTYLGKEEIKGKLAQIYEIKTKFNDYYWIVKSNQTRIDEPEISKEWSTGQLFIIQDSAKLFEIYKGDDLQSCSVIDNRRVSLALIGTLPDFIYEATKSKDIEEYTTPTGKKLDVKKYYLDRGMNSTYEILVSENFSFWLVKREEKISGDHEHINSYLNDFGIGDSERTISKEEAENLISNSPLCSELFK